MRRLLVCVPVGADPVELGGQPGIAGWRTDVVRDDQELLEVHGLQPRESPWRELHWLACADGTEPAIPGDWTMVAVDSAVAWDHDRTWDLGQATPGVKQISFLHKARGIDDDEFRRRYRAHVPEARRHMPGLWKYVQNEVSPPPEDPAGLYGLSELWFESVDDFRDRYWASPDNAAEEHEEVSQFLSGRTWSLLVTEHVRAE